MDYSDRKQWRAQNFRMEGSRSRRRRGEWGVGKGYTLPTGEGSGEGAVHWAPSPVTFFVFFVENAMF